MSSGVYPAYVDVNEIDRALDRIGRAIRGHRAEFLFGAGMSYESNVPTGAALSLELLERFFPQSGTNPPNDARRKALSLAFPLEAISAAIEGSSGRTRDDLTEDLKNIFCKDFAPSQPHNDFLAISYWDGHPCVRQVFTTNFDTIFEKAFGRRGCSITEKNARDQSVRMEQGLIPILHLHGMLEDGEFQITEADLYNSGFQALASAFRTALSTADAFVFVGYSMTDPDFRGVYMDFRKEIALRNKNDKFTYVVTPVADTYEYDLSRIVWRTRGAVLLPFTAGDFFKRLRLVLKSDIDRETQQHIMKKYNLKDLKAYQELVDQTAKILRIEVSEATYFLREARPKTGEAP